ncbi:hypothetical protein [Dyadobacter frigoris]|uniref:TIGR03067 domain-containing protein n=1 Tax=Dyadobacter frigoris TaxID=2576211 RepID=A0A4U6D5J0_9BACT|nr:hypothetical protein [Dyadobacter frigoris]TKT89284.1 hypothetical protein FDK13_23285 [Dyadobacter frigoris]GLU57060.1 hypothetical protein Dfri01_65210 [Dyadobacter frigoris]
MRKASIIFAALFLGIAFQGFSQSAAPADFFAGKWEINLSGTPAGDVKWTTNLVRKDGKLTGELSDATDAAKPKRVINKIDETADEIVIFFTSSQGDEIPLALTKTTINTLEGRLMDSFDANAKRLK